MDAERPHDANRRVAIANRRPTQNRGMVNPISTISKAKGYLLAVENGSTMRSMKD
jgi:hypothetical protein